MTLANSRWGVQAREYLSEMPCHVHDIRRCTICHPREQAKPEAPEPAKRRPVESPAVTTADGDA